MSTLNTKAGRAWAHNREIARVRSTLRQQASGVISLRQPRWDRLPLRLPRDVEHNASASLSLSSAINEHALDIERQEREAIIHRIYTRLGDGTVVHSSTITELAREIARQARSEPGKLGAAAIAGVSVVDGLCEHAQSLACVSALTASALGLSEDHVTWAAITGMMCDSGMMLLTHDVRRMARPLTDVEIVALHTHPALSAMLLEFVRASDALHAIPEQVQLAVYQHHEREDGSGYPRGQRPRVSRGSQVAEDSPIHDLARIVAVADTFVGALSPRAHRPGVSAAIALREVARQANHGILWNQAARALVWSMGMYPPGSTIRLSTGHVAKVISRGDSRELDRPIVKIIGMGSKQPSLDLSVRTRADVSVVGLAA